MKLRPAAIGAALALGVLAHPAAAEPAIKGLHLGMGLADGEIEAVYQTTLANEVEDSVGLTVPYDHIETRLTDGSRLSLHFSSPSDGTRLFWIRHSTSWQWPMERTAPELAAILAHIEERFGPAGSSVGPRDGSGDLLLIFPTPESGALPAQLGLAPQDLAGVQFLSFQQRVALLGRDFVGGVITIVVQNGKVAAVVEELVDHRRGASVLNPEG